MYYRKLIYCISFVVFFASCLNREPQSQTSKQKDDKKEKLGDSYYKITKVVDGDTFWILNDKDEKEKIRLIGIDAPESKKTGKKEIGYYGKEATAFAKSFLKDKYVRLEYDVQKLDRYGRTLAYVYLKDGTFLNDYLVREGYATVATFPPNVKYVDLFIESQSQARMENKGLWK